VVVIPRAGILVASALLAGGLLAACDDGDDRDGQAAGDAASVTTEPRWCDVYLEHLAEPDPESLAAVRATADDPRAGEATEAELDALARERCQAEWMGAAMGGGDTAGAAQAFFDALVAGDAIGARNVAAANAIARFEPWEPLVADPAAATPALRDIRARSFTVVLDATRTAVCAVESGVVLSCTIEG
jgi:hypothetical protein